jgi:hypothetical protein
MIVPLLQGGLGNQMFQIANAHAFAGRNDLEWGINYNLSFCPNQGYTAHKYRSNFFKNIHAVSFRPTKTFKENQFCYKPIPRQDNILLDGYFQSEKYFEDFKWTTKALFYFPEYIKEEVKEFINKFNNRIVIIHIRRGDYIKFQSHHVMQKSDYYMNAVNEFQEYQAIVCTDDWESVNKEMTFKKAIPSPFKSELYDLYLMSIADGIIMCNSSFSWWGAFLGKEDKKVIAPKNWFGPTGPKDTQDIYREIWKVI